jgi:PIN domain nuclease of toxin-antitoxin system
MTAVVADTHTIIWYLRETSRLSDNATIALDTATQTGNLIYIAAISFVEIIYLIERGRIPVKLFDQLISTLNQPDSALEIAPLDQTVAIALRNIDRTTVPEMPDRIIAATALSLNLPLVTRDLRIQQLTTIQTIW